MQLIFELKKTGNCDRMCCLKNPPWNVHSIIKLKFLKDFDKLFICLFIYSFIWFCLLIMLSYLVAIKSVRNSDFDDSDEVRNQRGKNIKLFENCFWS